MEILIKILQDIQQNRNNWVTDDSGENFEIYIKNKLVKNGFKEIDSNELGGILKTIDLKSGDSNSYNLQKLFHKKYGDNLPLDEKLKSGKFYVYQPFGSQKYPDFFIIEDGYIIPLECKSSKNKRPKWNGGLPKPNLGIYFFSLTAEDITFFLGKDILPKQIYDSLIKQDTEHKKLDKKQEEEINKSYQEHGIDKNKIIHYSRADNNYKGKTDFFDGEARKQRENSAIEIINNLKN